MNAADAVGALVKLGSLLSDAAQSRRQEAGFDMAAFLDSEAPVGLKGTVMDLMQLLDPAHLEAAIRSVEARQRLLQADRALSELEVEELIQYAGLTDAKILLNTARLKQEVKGDFYEWLLDEGLPGFIKVAKVVGPLLV